MDLAKGISASCLPLLNEIRKHLEETLLDSLQKGISFWEPWAASV